MTSRIQDEMLWKKVTEQYGGDMAWMVEAVAEVMRPEEVFDREDLQEWAENNGFVKAE
jgi:hypothetical protein